MTDLEITKLCAEAIFLKMDHPIESRGELFICYHPLEEPLPLYHKYDPLHDDAQAMALVEKLGLGIFQRDDGSGDPHALWDVTNKQETIFAVADNLNRAICECVAKMQKAKTA